MSRDLSSEKKSDHSAGKHTDAAGAKSKLLADVAAPISKSQAQEAEPLAPAE